MVWLKFVLCLAIILFAGTKLARYGDAIAEKTGLGRIWIGLLFLAAITSMPELVTGVSSVALLSPPVPDLALGTLFGSCALNFVILALLDILYRHAPLLSQASSRHIASAGWGILFIAIAAGGILAGGNFFDIALGWVGIPSVAIFILYLLGMRQMFRYERSHQALAASPQHGEISRTKVYLGFTLASMAVIAAGIWLSFIGDELAGVTGWSTSFVGSLFLAITTSTPELVVCIAALRLGAIDMAIADILGSNMFNLALIALVDLAYSRGSLLSSVSSSHLIIAAVVVVMNLIVILGLRFRQKRKTFRIISWHALALIGFYIFAAYALFRSGIGLG